MRKIEKAIEISEAKIQFVSLVDKAANKRQFLITKADGKQAQFSTVGKILKVDNTSHYITGIVYEPLVEDAHGNYMTEEEIRKSAYWFAKNSDKVDLQHSFEPVNGVSVVENYVAPSDMTISGQPIAKGTWVMTVEVNNNEIWDKVQKGEVTGFSMGGVGKYSEKETDISEIAEKHSLFKRLAEMFGFDLVEKSGAKALTANEKVEKAGRKISGKNYDTLKQISTGLNNFIAEFTDNENTETEDLNMVFENVQKTKESNTETNAETAAIEKAVDAAVEKIFNRVSAPSVAAEDIQKMIDDAIQKAFAPTKLDSTVEKAVTAEDVQAMVNEAVSKAVDPILKARGLSSNLNAETPVEKNENRHYLAGIL